MAHSYLATRARVCSGNSQAGANPTSDVLAFPVIGGSNNVIAKIDYSLNDKNAIHGEYVYGDGKPIGQSGTRIQPYWRGPYHIRSQVVRAAWVWTPNSAWVNEARFGYDRLLQNAQPGDCFPQQFGSPDYASLGFVSGVAQCGLGSITITGFTALGSGLGSSSLPAYFQGEDAVSRTFGKHVFKLGGGIRSYDWNGGSYLGSKRHHSVYDRFRISSQGYLIQALPRTRSSLGIPTRILRGRVTGASFRTTGGSLQESP